MDSLPGLTYLVGSCLRTGAMSCSAVMLMSVNRTSGFRVDYRKILIREAWFSGSFR